MKTRTKALCILAISMTFGIIVATQAAASRLPCDQLGWNVAIRGYRFYPPWSLLVWHARWSAVSPAVFRDAQAIVAAHAAGGALLVAIIKNMSPVVRPIGHAQWATIRDMKRAGLLAPTGTAVGRYRGRLLRYDGPEHQLVAGATRSGKGVGHVIPTLLSWPGSAVVHDIKGELWKATAGWRSRFSHCLFFDPTRLDSVRYNPLAEIRCGPNAIRDAMNASEMLVDPDGSKQQFDVWDLHAKQLITAVILHTVYVEPDERKHLGVVREQLLDLKNTLRDMIELPHRHSPETGAPEPHPEIARVAKELLRQAPKFVAGVAATAQSYLVLFADEIVVRNTAASDFTVGDLVCCDHPVSLYLQPPPSDIPRLRPLMRLLLNQSCRALLEHLDTDGRLRPKRHPLLLELDEFAALGRLEFFSTNLRQMAGYGIKVHLIVQSFNDLLERYGSHQTIIDNCHIISVFACADTVTQQRVSQMTGVVVEYRDSYGHRRWPRVSPDSIQQGEHVRPLLQPGEVRALPSTEQLVFVTGFPPMRTRKIRYFADEEFKLRIVSPPDPSADLDVPRLSDWHPKLGMPHDWSGERAKGDRIPTDEVFDQTLMNDEEWMPPDMFDASQPSNTPNSPGRDEYAL